MGRWPMPYIDKTILIKCSGITAPLNLLKKDGISVRPPKQDIWNGVLAMIMRLYSFLETNVKIPSDFVNHMRFFRP